MTSDTNLLQELVGICVCGNVLRIQALKSSIVMTCGTCYRKVRLHSIGTAAANWYRSDVQPEPTALPPSEQPNRRARRAAAARARRRS